MRIREDSIISGENVVFFIQAGKNLLFGQDVFLKLTDQAAP